MHLSFSETDAEAAPTPQVGVIYGAASATDFTCAVTDAELRRMDYVTTTTPDGQPVLCQVMGLKRESDLSFDQAMSLGLNTGASDPDETPFEIDEKVSAHVQVVGYRDDRGLLQVPRTPFRAGTTVHQAPEALIQETIGLLGSPDRGAYIGMLKGTRLPVVLDVNTIVQKHVSVLAKTGAGKSYATGVLLEELLKKEVAILIIDAHDEYHSLVSPNIEDKEVDRLLGFGLRPKGFADKIDLWTTEMNHRPDTGLLKLEGTAMQANEIVDLLGGKISGAQQGILYQAIKDARNQDPLYALRDVIDQCHGNKSNSKWNVISALEALDATGLFSDDGIDVDRIVQKGRCNIVSLKGVPPDVQEVVVARLATQLFEARKSTIVPPFLMVVEEAHNYCPERGIGNAVSLGILRTIASEGRKFGMGLCVVSQRPAKIDKNVLSQCNTQLILKVTNPNDLKAIVGSVEGLTSEAADEIARLPVGVALIAGGNLGMPVLAEVRTRQSRHGGASVDIVKGADDTLPQHARMDRDPRTYRHSKQKTIVDEPDEDALAGDTGPIETMSAPHEHDAASGARTAPEPRPSTSETSGRRKIRWGTKKSDADTQQGASANVAADLAKAARDDTEGVAAAPHSVGTTPPQDPGPTSSAGPATSTTSSSSPVIEEVRPSELGPTNGHNKDREAAAPTPEPVARPQVIEPRDVRIHRVANRVGYVATLRPEETLQLLRKAAARSHVNADRYLEPFARVGRTHCHREEPECVPCPMAAKCAFKQKLDAKRDRDKRRVLGRFFGKE